MPAFTASEVGPMFAATIFAWLISGVVYSVFRFAERMWLVNAPARLLSLALVFLFLISPFNPGYWELGFLAFPSLLGGWFHRRSGGASNFWFSAALLAMSATVVSFASGLFLAESYWDMVLPSKLSYAPIVFILGLIIYPNLIPLALWLFNSLRIRPGLDVPLETENP